MVPMTSLRLRRYAAHSEVSGQSTSTASVIHTTAEHHSSTISRRVGTRREKGVIVTAWEDNNRSGSTDYSRKRMAWLVLSSKVYPINAAAANVLGLLYDGMPQPIQKRAGLVHTDERGRTMMDQLGFEENTFERRFSGGDPFPTCP